MKSPLQDYFDFSRKEQVGLMMLVCIIIFCLVLLNFHEYFFPRQAHDVSAKEQALIAALETERGEKEKTYAAGQKNKYPKSDKKRLQDPFQFDPNSLDEEGYVKLGFSEKQAKSIRNYLTRGGRVYKVEDFKKLYVVNDFMYERLKDFIKIEKSEATSGKSRDFASSNRTDTYKHKKKVDVNPKTKALVDINAANKEELMAVRGIGPNYAARIIKYREIYWGFSSLDQLTEFYGIQDYPERIEDLKTQMMVGEYKAAPININTCKWVDLVRNPYIEKEVANSILAIRKTHGEYVEVSDIQQSHLINDALYEKISPYLTVGSR